MNGCPCCQKFGDYNLCGECGLIIGKDKMHCKECRDKLFGETRDRADENGERADYWKAKYFTLKNKGS